MAKKERTKIITKKHLARQERERRQTRIITAVAIGIVAIVILGIAYGILNDTLFLRLRPAVTVNGESLSLQDFQVRVRASRQSLIAQYMQYEQLAQMFGVDPSTDPQLSQTMSQITSQLDSTTAMGSQVIDDMVNNLLIRQYAKANGITVTSDDVEKAIQAGLNYYPQGTPTPTLTPTPPIFPTLDATQMALVTQTPTPTVAPTSTPRPTNTPDLTATPTPIPSITPTATPYTLQGFEQQYQGVLKSVSPVGMSEAQFRRIYYEDGLYQERVKAKVTADVPHEEEQVWVRDILVADKSKADSVYNQLKIGADFATLASMYSIDTATKDNGGDLGWFGKGTQPADFEAAVWTMKVGAINTPFQTTTGYHIVEVLGHEVRPLTDTQYQDAVNTAFTSWLQTERDKSKVVINDAWTNYVPTSPTLAEVQANDYATQTAYVATYFAQQTTSPTK
jgi:peptidyl-prolyl cis-trans isomerase D